MNNSDCAFLECWLHFDASDKFGKAYFEPCQTSTMKLSPKIVKPLSTNFTKYSNTPKQFAGGQTRKQFVGKLPTLKQFVGKLPTHCLSVFDHFVGLVLKALTTKSQLL